MFLETFTAASLGVLAAGAFADIAQGQSGPEARAHSTAQGPFETAQIEVSGNTVFVRRYGKARPFCWCTVFPVPA